MKKYAVYGIKKDGERVFIGNLKSLEQVERTMEIELKNYYEMEARPYEEK